MAVTKKDAIKNSKFTESDFHNNLWEESWTRIKTVVDVAKEPIVILNNNLRVTAANRSFYTTFKVKIKDTEGKFIYELGEGQWNIPSLLELLKDILFKNTFFKGFQVVNDFPYIGKRIMILNARGIHREIIEGQFPRAILLAIEDVSEIMGVADNFVRQANRFGTEMMEKTEKLESEIDVLTKNIDIYKNKQK